MVDFQSRVLPPIDLEDPQDGIQSVGLQRSPGYALSLGNKVIEGSSVFHQYPQTHEQFDTRTLDYEVTQPGASSTVPQQ